MSLSRKKGIGLLKYCNVVKDLITLHDLGFKEDDYNRWEFLIYSNYGFDHSTGKSFSYRKKLVASGNNLHLVTEHDGHIDSVIIWSKSFAGVISKNELIILINIILKGNGSKKRI